MDKVSIIVPIFNSEKYLRTSIESILNQSYKNFELILINDGSSDGSLDICKEYIDKDERIVLINKNNEGVSSARNEGIDKSTGKYIVFCDSDDYIEKNYLQNLYNEIIKYNCDIVFSGVYRDIYNISNNKICNEVAGVSEEKLIEVKNLDVYLEYIMRTMPGPFLSPWGKMYKADIIRNNKIYFDNKMVCYEDHVFNLRVISNCKSLFFSKIINYHFRGIIGNGGIKKRKKFDLVYDISSYHKEINKLLSKLKYNKGLKDFIESSFIEHYKLVFQKLILEESNISKADRNNVLKHLCKDNDFCNFLTHNKGRLRLYTLIKILVDIKCYNLSYFIIKNRLR